MRGAGGPVVKKKSQVRAYRKPLFRKASGVDFVLKEINSLHGVSCRQCSSCHGCR
jgi:hypothetical protein